MNFINPTIYRISIILLFIIVNFYCQQPAIDQELDHQESQHTEETHTDSGTESDQGHSSVGEISLSSEKVKIGQIKVETIIAGEIDRQLLFYGSVEWRNEGYTKIYASYPGRIKKIWITPGESVGIDQPLFLLENSENLQTYIIRSPLEGNILSLNTHIDEFVDPMVILAEIGNPRQLRVRMDIDVTRLPLIRIQLPVIIQSLDEKKEATSVIQTIGFEIDQGTQQSAAWINLAYDAENPWIVGEFTRIRVIKKECDSSLWNISINAIQRLDNQTIIFLAEDDTTFIPYPVVIGETNETRLTIIGEKPPIHRYVSQGSFILKSIMLSNEFGGHAGHGH